MNARIGSLTFADPTRASFDAAVTEHELRQLAALPAVRTLQTAAPVPDAVWSLLNEGFFSTRPDVELRVYGYYEHGMECDLGFAARLPNVRHFSADNLMRAKNVEAIAAMPALQSLSLGIFEAEEFAVLSQITPALTKLGLHATRSRKPRLDGLARFERLRSLYLEGQSKGIEVISGLRQIEDLSLRSITTDDLSYLAPLARLRSLEIKLGGIRSFVGVEGKDSIHYLELWQIRGLDQVNVLAALPGLQNVFLQNLPKVQRLPALVASSALRRVVLDDLKGLQDFTSLQEAPALAEFALLSGDRQQPEQLLPVLRNPAVRSASAFFGAAAKNRAFAQLRDAHGKREWEPRTPFEYR
ncbi:MAG TPA: hypothetical protein VJS12_23080 [Steroidobacteraceae bacterium]|nr:hypothetical protein [Steroidobacteraceae bacterium]